MERSVNAGWNSLVPRVVKSGAGVGLICTIAVLIGCAGSIDHNNDRAAKKAEEFARIAFVNRDFEAGYKLLAEGTRRYVSVEKFTEAITRLHPKAYPMTVTAQEFEPMPGEKAIYVFLTGQNADERFYYRLTMEGTAVTDYRVLQFDRSTNRRR
jgi:hypothetical protein